MSPLEAARRWARGWKRAWPEHDVEAVRALYAAGARFHSHPFRGPQDPGGYAAWAFDSEQPGASVSFGEPRLLDDGGAVVEWRAAARAVTVSRSPGSRCCGSTTRGASSSSATTGERSRA